MGILILFVLSTFFAVVVLLIFDKYRKSVAVNQDANADNLATGENGNKSFVIQYLEDVLEGVYNRIKNPMPTIVLLGLVALTSLFKTAEQTLIIVSLIIIFWYLPALFVFGPASRMRTREYEKLAADRHLKHMNSVKQAEEAMQTLRDKWEKLEPEERRHQEMLHQIESSARRNQIETEIAIDSAVDSLEQQIRNTIRH